MTAAKYKKPFAAGDAQFLRGQQSGLLQAPSTGSFCIPREDVPGVGSPAWEATARGPESQK